MFVAVQSRLNPTASYAVFTQLYNPQRKGEKEARKLTDEQKKHNKKVGGIRVTVESSIGRIKQYARMTEPYGGTEDELNCEMNVVAGLVNLHLMKTLHRGNPRLRRRFLG